MVESWWRRSVWRRVGVSCVPYGTALAGGFSRRRVPATTPGDRKSAFESDRAPRRERRRYLDREDDGRGGEEVRLEERERRAHQLDREIAEMDRARLRILAEKEAAKSEQSREEAILRQLRAARDAAEQRRQNWNSWRMTSGCRCSPTRGRRQKHRSSGRDSSWQV